VIVAAQDTHHWLLAIVLKALEPHHRHRGLIYCFEHNKRLPSPRERLHCYNFQNLATKLAEDLRQIFLELYRFDLVIQVIHCGMPTKVDTKSEIAGTYQTANQWPMMRSPLISAVRRMS
jgi:hypothetical protein